MPGNSAEIAATVPKATIGHTVVMMPECWQTGDASSMTKPDHVDGLFRQDSLRICEK
jgi:hypothetical protein